MLLQLDPLDHHFDPEGQVPTPLGPHQLIHRVREFAYKPDLVNFRPSRMSGDSPRSVSTCLLRAKPSESASAITKGLACHYRRGKFPTGVVGYIFWSKLGRKWRIMGRLICNFNEEAPSCV